MNFKITIKDLHALYALRHACGNNAFRPVLHNIAYIKSAGRFFATDGHIMRSIRVEWSSEKPETNFIVTLPVLKFALAAADQIKSAHTAPGSRVRRRAGCNLAVAYHEVLVECQAFDYPNILAFIPQIPKSVEGFEPLRMVGIDPSLIRRFVKTYVKAPECFVFGFTGALTGVHVFLPNGEWQGVIMPKQLFDFKLGKL